MTLNQIKALRTAAIVLVDQAGDDPDIFLGERLPPKHQHRYTKAFLKRMLRSLKAVAKRLSAYLDHYEQIIQQGGGRSYAEALEDSSDEEHDEPDVFKCESVAEELALYLIREDAEIFLGDPDHQPIAGITQLGPHDDDWDFVDMSLFRDMDFEDLWEPSADGYEREDTDVARQLGIVNLEFKNWFDPFKTSTPASDSKGQPG